MKLKILSLSKTETGTVNLPIQFYEPVRTDLIRRAFLVIQSNKRQPYGAKPGAGQRHSAELSRRRRKYRGSYGIGISRVTRKILSRRGTRMNWVGAISPGTVGGRRAHPPKVEKDWTKSINIKERRKAIRSALAATIKKELVLERGHKIPENYPFIVDDKIEEIKQTRILTETISKLGFKEELSRAKNKGTKGLLLITTNIDLKKICSNIPGFEAELVSNLNAEILAPGGIPGRITLFTKSAMKELTEKELYTQKYKGDKPVKKEKKEEVKEVKVKKEVKKITKPATKKPVTKKKLATKKGKK
ncbi:MAG: 50S ribosomal protein L4 [archaeon]